jgi:hypothetical protein
MLIRVKRSQKYSNEARNSSRTEKAIDNTILESRNTEGKSKSKETFKKKHISCKFTETELILLFNVIPSTSTHRLQIFKIFLVASLINFGTFGVKWTKTVPSISQKIVGVNLPAIG